MMRVLVNLKHQGSSHNVVLFAANVGLAWQFLSSCQTSGVLSEQTNLLITTLVGFCYQFSLFKTKNSVMQENSVGSMSISGWKEHWINGVIHACSGIITCQAK